MASIRVIGDTIYLDGEPVADIRPDVRASLRGDLEEAIELAEDGGLVCKECGEEAPTLCEDCAHDAAPHCEDCGEDDPVVCRACADREGGQAPKARQPAAAHA